MGAKEKKAKYEEKFRREILDAGRELFVGEGTEKFSMRKLAANMGYSLPTIHHCFKDQDELLFALCEEVAERFFDDLSDIKTSYDDPLEALRQVLLNLIAIGFNSPDEYKLLFITRHRSTAPLRNSWEMNRWPGIPILYSGRLYDVAS